MLDGRVALCAGAGRGVGAEVAKLMAANGAKVIINDPGTSEHVRKVFPRKNLVDAWACSRNTVYLVYPRNSALPDDPFGHWDSGVSASANAVPK